MNRGSNEPSFPLQPAEASAVENSFVSTVLDHVSNLVVIFDSTGRVVRFNRVCEAVSGYTAAEIVGKTLWDTVLFPGDRIQAMRTFASMRRAGLASDYEGRWQTRDGRTRLIQWTATALSNGHQNAAFILATGVDVTLQREAEETLRDSEARYRHLVEGSLGAVFTHDERGILLSVNNYCAENLGYAVTEMLGRPLVGFLQPGEDTAYKEYLRDLIATGAAQGTFHLSHRNGAHRVLAFRNRLIRGADRGYALCFAIDITEKMHAEESLSRLTQQSNSVLNSVGDGILGMDLQGLCTVCNPAAARMLGYGLEQIATEVMGRNLHDLMHHHRADGSVYPESESPILNAAHENEPARVFGDLFWRADGTSLPVDYVACPILENGSVTGVVVAFIDITERSALDRMKDEFVSTVSHELRTPLTSMNASLNLLASGVLANRPDKQEQMLRMAIGNTDRLIKLVNDILELERIGSGKAELHYSSVSVDTLLMDAADLLSASVHKAGLRYVFELEHVNAWVDGDRIVQTVTNLIANAMKFTPAGGTIKLSARSLTPCEVQLEIADTGRGIPPDKLEHIFGRFQQADASDSRNMNGTGLGLAICRSIVSQHGGKIWAESVVGEGSRFFINLPAKPSSHL